MKRFLISTDLSSTTELKVETDRIPITTDFEL